MSRGPLPADLDARRPRPRAYLAASGATGWRTRGAGRTPPRRGQRGDHDRDGDRDERSGRAASSRSRAASRTASRTVARPVLRRRERVERALPLAGSGAPGPRRRPPAPRSRGHAGLPAPARRPGPSAAGRRVPRSVASAAASAAGCRVGGEERRVAGEHVATDAGLLVEQRELETLAARTAGPRGRAGFAGLGQPRERDQTASSPRRGPARAGRASANHWRSCPGDSRPWSVSAARHDERQAAVEPTHARPSPSCAVPRGHRHLAGASSAVRRRATAAGRHVVGQRAAVELLRALTSRRPAGQVAAAGCGAARRAALAEPLSRPAPRPSIRPSV